MIVETDLIDKFLLPKKLSTFDLMKINVKTNAKWAQDIIFDNPT
jgi:hypothetical protein